MRDSVIQIFAHSKKHFSILIGGNQLKSQQSLTTLNRPLPTKMNNCRKVLLLFFTSLVQSSALVALPNRFDFSGIICDMDGVLWRGSEKIPESIEALNLLKATGKEIVFVTNSSGKLRSEYAQKLRGLGYPAMPSNVITASSVTATFLRDSIIGVRKPKHPPKVFMVGNAALREELESCGFEVLFVSDSDVAALEEDEFAEISDQLDSRVKAVVVGMDNAFSYRKLAIASLYLQNGCAFVATNPDSADRIPGGFWPEVGPLAAAIESASGVKPTMCGKPSEIMVRHVMNHLGCDKSRVFDGRRST
jgi:4-nitrophenyl phosphatase